ncbi:MAG: hypothetical protein M0P66_13945, partial [Salinivirgaceae bacterium]|nr:hypothetical protein [Salinivirgaceae bacterium]
MLRKLNEPLPFRYIAAKGMSCFFRLVNLVLYFDRIKICYLLRNFYFGTDFLSPCYLQLRPLSP